MPSSASDRSGANGPAVAVASDHAGGRMSLRSWAHRRARASTYAAIGARAGTARSTWRRSPTTVMRQCSSTTVPARSCTSYVLLPGADVRPLGFAVVVPVDTHHAGDLPEHAVRAEQAVRGDVPFLLQREVITCGVAGPRLGDGRKLLEEGVEFIGDCLRLAVDPRAGAGQFFFHHDAG